MTSKPGKQTITIYILSNISRSKSNQIMKFGQLLEHNMKNIFLEKLNTKCGGETTVKPFSKKVKIELISGSTYSLFLLYAKLRAIEID